MPNTIQKQPWDSFLVGADYSKTFMTGEQVRLVTSSVVATDKAGQPASTGMDGVLAGSAEVGTSPADKVSSPKTNALLRVRVTGGRADKSPYKLTFRGASTFGNQYEVDVYMIIKEQ